MADETKIDISLDPKRVMGALEDLSKEVKSLAEKLEQSLGKDAPKSIGKLEDAAERGTNKIRSEEHTSELPVTDQSRMPSSA